MITSLTPGREENQGGAPDDQPEPGNPGRPCSSPQTLLKQQLKDTGFRKGPDLGSGSAPAGVASVSYPVCETGGRS